MSQCKHQNRVSGKKPGTETCKDCSWMFPCRESCGHSDCIEFNAALPTCWFCKKTVTGNPSNFGVPGCSMLKVDPNGKWGTIPVHGVTRALHWECKV